MLTECGTHSDSARVLAHVAEELFNSCATDPFYDTG